MTEQARLAALVVCRPARPARGALLVGLALAVLLAGATRGRASAPAPSPSAPLPRASAPAPRNAISLEPLSVVFARTIALEYERGLGRFGLHAGFALTLGDVSISGEAPRSGDYTALGVTLGARFYPWSEAPAGAFFGAFTSLAWVQAEASTTTGTLTSDGLGWAAGAMLGWTWLLGSSFELSLGLGAAYHQLDIDADGAGASPSQGRSGLLPALRLAVGAAF